MFECTFLFISVRGTGTTSEDDTKTEDQKVSINDIPTSPKRANTSQKLDTGKRMRGTNREDPEDQGINNPLENNWNTKENWREPSVKNSKNNSAEKDIWTTILEIEDPVSVIGTSNVPVSSSLDNRKEILKPCSIRINPVPDIKEENLTIDNRFIVWIEPAKNDSLVDIIFILAYEDIKEGEDFLRILWPVYKILADHYNKSKRE